MRVNIQRIQRDIENLSSFNATPGKGITRLAFTKEDKEAREYIRNQMEKIGLEIHEDGYGNLFGRKYGRNKELPSILVGSHYDTVINGGSFDGMAGLVTGLEVARYLVEEKIEHDHTLEVVAFNDEEGVRFGNGISNSRAITGDMKEEELDNTFDKNGISLRKAMEDYGIKPDLKSAIRPKGSIKAFFELHIEQGPVLIENNKEVGIVQTIVGLDRYDIRFTGKAGHAGTTPMNNRKDAFLPAAEFTLGINKIGKEAGYGAVATVGEIKLLPNASNVIPGFVQISVDIRATREDVINNIHSEMTKLIKELDEKYPVDIDLRKTLYISPVDMSEDLFNLLDRKAEELGIKYEKMNSGAGHDAMMMARIAPTSLVFVPSKDGLSHHPEEWTDYEDLAKGIELILSAVLELI